MPLVPADWEAAGAALAAAQPANAVEARAKVSLQSDLAVALRAFKVGLHLHERVSPVSIEAFVFLTQPITTPLLAVQLLGAFWPAFRSHFGDAVAHVTTPPAVALPGFMPSDPLEAANAFKSSFNAHVAAAGLHFGDATGAALVSADATGSATLVALAEEIRLKAAPHRKDGGQVTVVTTIRASTQQSQYAERLSAHNRRVAQSQATFSDAEPCARAAAVALGYVPSPAWLVLGYSQASTDALLERFRVLRAQVGYAANEYCSTVAEPIAQALNRDAYFGTAPIRPPADAPTTTTTIVGPVNTGSEAALEAVIERVNEFVAGLNAVP